MSALLKAELLKLRTTRTFFALVGSAVAISVLLLLLAIFLSDESDTWEASDLFALEVTATFVLLLGVVGITGEWRHRTITSTVLAAPHRVRLLAAKVLSYAIAGALLALIVSVCMGLIGTVVLSIRADVEIAVVDILDVLWRNVAVAALLGALGVVIGAVVRNQIAAVIGVVVFTFVIESILFGLAPDVGKYGPTTAPTGIYDMENVFDDDYEFLSPLPGLLVTLAWIGGLFAAGAALLRGRDLT